jgi:uncharacterized membrane protein YhaH (DUF805 family)
MSDPVAYSTLLHSETTMFLAISAERVRGLMSWLEYYFISLRAHPHWLSPLIVSSLGTFVLTYCSHPYARDTLLHLPRDQRPELAAVLQAVGTITLTMALLTNPLLLLLKTVLGAVLLTTLTKIIVGHSRLLLMFALTSHLSILALLQPLYVLMVLRVRDINKIRNRSDLDVPVGLNFLIPKAGYGLNTLLSSVSIFEALILWCAVVGVGILCECSRGAALLIVFGYWVIGTAFKMWSAVISTPLTHCFIRAFSLVEASGLGNRLSARLQGFKYLNAIDLSVPRGGQRCGPAAMQIILRQNGMDVPVESLLQELMDSPRGTSVRRMKEVAERYGFRTVARRVSLAESPLVPLPSIALLKRGHYVVVEAIAPDASVTIIDPSIGRCRVPAPRFFEMCSAMLLIRRNSERTTGINRICEPGVCASPEPAHVTTCEDRVAPRKIVAQE